MNASIRHKRLNSVPEPFEIEGILSLSYRPFIVAIYLTLLAISLPAQAKTQVPPVLDKPIYDPVSKSYFELVHDQKTTFDGPNWGKAKGFASKRYFKNRQGRLAIIKSAQTEMLIHTELRPAHNAWIGLYYDCASRQLTWVNGQILKKGEFTNWDPVNWNHAYKGMFCPNGITKMPVFIAVDGYRRFWAIQLPAKKYYEYVIEYPANGEGAPTPEKPAHTPAEAAPKPALNAPGGSERKQPDTTLKDDTSTDDLSKLDHQGRNEE